MEIKKIEAMFVFVSSIFIVLLFDEIPRIVFNLTNTNINLDLITILREFSAYFLIKALIFKYKNEKITFNNIFFKIDLKNLINFILSVSISFGTILVLLKLRRLDSIIFIFSLLIMIFVSLRLLFMPYIVVNENVNFVQSIKRSMNLTKNRVLKIVERYFIFILFELILLGIALLVETFVFKSKYDVFNYFSIKKIYSLPLYQIIWYGIINTLLFISSTIIMVDLFNDIIVEKNKKNNEITESIFEEIK